MKLTVAGCGDAFGSGGNHYSCYYLEGHSFSMLMECGASAMPSLKRLDIDPSGVDIVLISHLHGDHYAGLPFFFLDASIIKKRRKPLDIVGPPGLEDNLKALMRLLYPGSESALKSFPVKYHSYKKSEEIKVGNVTVIPFGVAHTRATRPHGVRIAAGGKTIGFSGDSGWCDNLVKIAANTDLFICECNNFSTTMSSHLDYQSLMQKKPLFKTRRMVLTHFGGEMVKAIKEGKISIETVSEGLEIEV